MSTTIRIEIETRIFEKLQTLAKPFVDTPNSVIERILNERESHQGRTAAKPISFPRSQAGVDGHFTTPRRVKLPFGELRAIYKRRGETRASTFDARITREGIEFDGQVFDNPSAAGIHAKKLAGATGDAASTNGWEFWEWHDKENQRWVPIDTFRNKRVPPPLTLADL